MRIIFQVDVVKCDLNWQIKQIEINLASELDWKADWKVDWKVDWLEEPGRACVNKR